MPLLMKKENIMKLKITCPNCKKEFEANIEGANMPKGTYFLVPMEEMDTKKETTTSKDPVEESIRNDGFIKNHHLYRRWVMAQMLRHFRNEKDPAAFDHYFVSGKPYKYAWETTLNEMKAMKHLYGEELIKRERFFNLEVVKEMANEYNEQVKNYIAKLPKKWTVKNGKWAYYSKIPYGKEIKRSPKDKEFWASITEAVNKINEANTYWQMQKAVENFMATCPMHLKMPKPNAWKNAFKGAGAYYTMDNMIKFHHCHWMLKSHYLMLPLSASLAELEKAVEETKGEYYRLYAMMCDFVAYNHFDFDQRMKKIKAARETSIK